MKDLTIETLIAVFEEIFGFGLFWAMVAAAALGAVAFLYVLIRDRNLVSRRLVRAELLAPIGAFAAIWFVQAMTSSGFRDIGGPVDMIVLIAIGAAGAVGLTIFAYVAQALIGGPQRG